MKRLIWCICSLILLTNCNNDVSTYIPQTFISKDVTNFWIAYDSIQTTDDSIKQMEHLNGYFLYKASKGQKKMMELRGYTPEQYLKAMKSYPKFWNSLRSNFSRIMEHNTELLQGVIQLSDIYPDLKPAKIYYTMGLFRSPGTAQDSLVLIGSEFALGDTLTITDELPKHTKDYFKINPIDHIRFLIVHEYVHSQQRPLVNNLLCTALYEGVAEFVAATATGMESPFPAREYSLNNKDRIKQRFEEDMFNWNTTSNWFWNSSDNEFGVSDLGYYVGFEIAQLHYEQSSDKKTAIKELIELDYENQQQLEKLVNATEYFSADLDELEARFQNSRPTVTLAEPIAVDSTLNSSIGTLTIHFSEPMDSTRRNFDYGPLGIEASIQLKEFLGFSEDRKSIRFTIQPLEKSKRYQLTIGNGFQNQNGIPLKPYLLDFRTN